MVKNKAIVEEYNIVIFSEPLPSNLRNSELARGPDSLIGKHIELERICKQEGGKLIEKNDDDFTAGTSDPEVDYWSYGTKYLVGGAEVTNHVEMRGKRETTIRYKKDHRPDSLINKIKNVYLISK